MFYGLNTFMKVNNTNTKFQIIGMPIDFLTSHRPGTRFGPEAIRKASSMICDEDGIHPIFRNDPANDIEDLGDIPIDITNQKLSKY